MARSNSRTNYPIVKLVDASFQRREFLTQLYTSALTQACRDVLQCDEFPLIEGDFLELPFKSRNDEYLLRLDDSPPNGKLTVGLAVNRAFTTLSFNSSKTAVYVSQWKAKSTLVPASQI